MALKQGFKKSTRAAGEILRGGFWAHPIILRNIPFALYLAFLSIMAIYMAHRAEGNVESIAELKVRYDELESEYLETKSELMIMGTESEVKARASQLGLKDATKAPLKIERDE